ncbi:MAG: type II secretion system protein [Campylobacterales bacterium]|nr:type II secretion system protein [Campylobacterales bacterium]
MYHKSFTIIEIVFVILIISILSTFIAPSFKQDNLQLAANQLLSHIKYTQHLAMSDNKFIPNEKVSNYSGIKQQKHPRYWFNGRWQIFFSSDGDAVGDSAYVIFSDTPSTSTTYLYRYEGNPNHSQSIKEVALDPLNTSKYLIGTNFSSFDSDKKNKINEKLNLNKTYGITKVDLSKGCSSSNRIFFDYNGKVFNSYLSDNNNTNNNNIYNPYININKDVCQIELQDSSINKSIYICITPETGYSYISKTGC